MFLHLAHVYATGRTASDHIIEKETDTMKYIKKIKDPGSAITHFIGILMALFAATPLLIKAGDKPDQVHLISLGILYPVCFCYIRQVRYIIPLIFRQK